MPLGKQKSKTELDVFLCCSTRVDGEVEAAGKTVTLKKSDALLLISYGKAVDADDEKAVAEAKKQLKQVKSNSAEAVDDKSV